MRRLRTIAATVLVAAAPAATAEARPVQTATFKVSVEGVQKTTWTTDHPGTNAACDGPVTGRGTETVRFASKPVTARAMVTPGLSAPLFTTPAHTMPTLRLHGKVTRRGTIEAAPDPECGGGGVEPTPRDCGTRRFKDVALQLEYRLAAKPKDQLDLSPSRIDDPFANCPSGGESFPTLVTTRDGEPIRTDLPRGELFDAAHGKLIVIARGSETLLEGEHTYRTTSRWEVTLRRVR